MKAAFLLAALALASTSLAQTRVHCGGPAYTDSKGNVWQADTGFTGGAPYGPTVATISGTSDPQLFEDIRYVGQSGSFSYTFAVPNGAYAVNLSFAELWVASAGRVFNVKVNGAVALSNFDIFAKAGLDHADIESIPVNVTGGSVSIEVDGISNNAFLDAIEILPTGPTPPPPQPISLSISGNLSFDDGMPVTGTVQISQVTFLPDGTTNNNVLGNFTPDASGNISGAVSLLTNFQDQCTFNFYLFDSANKQVGFMQQQLPGVTFKLVHSVSTFKVVLVKASCATACTLAPGSTMGVLGQ